ncbi:hypothetical protein ABGV42_01420 [Paenibacillus pabuli]|uniref:hypothetical protein n=1 Tax=Paenibacillus pabuli TaxID=1472 RepID=UPI003242D50F
MKNQSINAAPAEVAGDDFEFVDLKPASYMRKLTETAQNATVEKWWGTFKYKLEAAIERAATSESLQLAIKKGEELDDYGFVSSERHRNILTRELTELGYTVEYFEDKDGRERTILIKW